MRPQPYELDVQNYPFSIEIPTRFGDIDTLRHINNVAIAQLFEEARVRFGLHSQNKPFGKMGEFGRLVTVSSVINYLGEVFYPDPVTLAVGVDHIGTTSHILSCLMLQYDKAVAHSRTTLVLSSEQGQATSIPEQFKAILREYSISKS